GTTCENSIECELSHSEFVPPVVGHPPSGDRKAACSEGGQDEYSVYGARQRFRGRDMLWRDRISAHISGGLRLVSKMEPPLRANAGLSSAPHSGSRRRTCGRRGRILVALGRCHGGIRRGTSSGVGIDAGASSIHQDETGACSNVRGPQPGFSGALSERPPDLGSRAGGRCGGGAAVSPSAIEIGCCRFRSLY